MADVTNTQIFWDGPGAAVVHFTNQSDGTGGTVTFNPSASLQGAPAQIAIDRLIGATALMGVNLLWDGTTALLAYTLGANTFHNVHWREANGILLAPCPGLIVGLPVLAGRTGNLLIKTVTGSNAALRVKVQEQIVPALAA